MADSAQDRQLPASQRKIDKARADGQVARSRDLGHFAAVAGGVGLLVATAPQLHASLLAILSAGLRFDVAQVHSTAALTDRLGLLGLQMLLWLAPLLLASVGLALASGLLSGGWNFTWKPLLPDFGKLDPLSGLGRLVSGQQLTATLHACLLALVLGVVGSAFLVLRWDQAAGLLALPLPSALSAATGLLADGVVLLCGVLAAFALVDVPLQRQLLLRRLRMSVQELKQEFKEQEGSAEIKGQLRRRQRELASQRMMAQVPLADLVVMNPTHYAVALKYDEAQMGAPRVLAKGADLMALRIRDRAREHQVPVLQAPALARALYAHAELDQEIPARLFGAVAQVLAWVYQLREGSVGRRGESAPVPEVPADLDPHQQPGGTDGAAGPAA